MGGYFLKEKAFDFLDLTLFKLINSDLVMFNRKSKKSERE